MAAVVHASALLQWLVIFCLVLYSHAITYTSNDIFHMDSGNCGTLYSKFGTLYSHASRHEVSKHSPFSGYAWCSLRIRGEVGRQIHIFAEDGQVDLNGQGQIRIYDGDNNYPNWMWSTSGSDPMPTLSSSGNSMKIEYYTNWNAGGGATGFTLYYSSYEYPPCAESGFLCIDPRRCIEATQVCDGHLACPDHSDETDDCPPPTTSLISGLSSTQAILIIVFLVIFCSSIVSSVVYCYSKKRKHGHTALTVNVVHPGQPPPPLFPMHQGQQTTIEMARPEPPPYPVGNPEGMPVPPPPPILY